MSYRVYVTDSLFLRGQNKYPNKRWAELIERKPIDTRKPEEIVADIISRAGLVIREEGETDEPI